MPHPHLIWITWEAQRRSLTLARSLGARLHVLLARSDDMPNRVLRYTYLLAKTVFVLIRERPAICCCQNPSVVLAIWLALLRPLFRYSLVVDRHSNFNFSGNTGLKWRLLDYLSDLSIRQADLTLVTNAFLADLVLAAGGRAVVLEDKIPDLQSGGRRQPVGVHNVAFVCSFDEDEPIDAAIEAAGVLDPSWHMYITGNYRPHLRRFPALAAPPRNVTLTGFLSDADYQTLLRSVDVLLVLTKHDHTLMCGGYEAVSLGKPCAASDTSAMRRYFRKGFVFTENSRAAIATALTYAVEEMPRLQIEIASLRRELEGAWDQRFALLIRQLGKLRGPGSPASLSASDAPEDCGGGSVN